MCFIFTDLAEPEIWIIFRRQKIVRVAPNFHTLSNKNVSHLSRINCTAQPLGASSFSSMRFTLRKKERRVDTCKRLKPKLKTEQNPIYGSLSRGILKK